MDYAQTIDYLFSRLPMFSRIGAAAYKPDLVNTRLVCTALGEPQEKFKSIHIAGTNGKGSTSHMLAAIFQSAGYRTGLYTSPHLKDFRERIRINGEMISEDEVVNITQQLMPLIGEVQPSFFEITVGMAFAYFANSKVDIAIIETGLGGRLDSTNIITPELSVITNIGLDHQALLGNTLEKIAREKAGIIKPGVPIVVGEVIPESAPVFTEVARQQHAPLTIASKTRQAMDWSWKPGGLEVSVAEEHQVDHRHYLLDLPGLYQVKNLLTVLEACTQMIAKGWQLSEAAIENGLRHTRTMTGLHGRWEQLHQHPKVIADVAHNVDGIRQLVQQLELTPHRDLHIIIGMVNDKDILPVLQLLPKQAIYHFTQAGIPRALPAETLKEMAKQVSLDGDVFADVNLALTTLLQHTHPDDLILVCGSVFLVGEIEARVFYHT